ncbi:MAG: NDP-sugar synthase [Gemmatimonadota bacterium]|nr:NDP-sugar synthase [Gemmatimonadota bacterium]
MKALVLAAGLGTRLLPLTARKSKVTLPLAGSPVLVRVIRTFRSLGVEQFAVNIHHAADTVRACLADADERVVFSFEKEILGTGGALFGVKDFLHRSGTFLLVNGDCYYSGFNLDEALEFHRRRNALATMVLVDMPAGRDYSAVEIDTDGRVFRIAGRPERPPSPGLKALHFTGIHILEPEILKEISPGFSDINRDIYPPLVVGDAGVYGFHTSFRSLDLGTPDRLLEAAFSLLEEEYNRKGPSSILIGESCCIHHSALLEAPLEIGCGVKIGPGCRLRRSIVGNRVTLEENVSIHDSLAGDNVFLEAGEKISHSIIASLDGERILKKWR